MLIEFVWLILSALAAYGFFCLVRELLLWPAAREIAPSLGIHVGASFREDELWEDIQTLRRAALGTPILLVDCRLSSEALCELSELGTEVYLMYKEYHVEDRDYRKPTRGR